MSGFNKIAEHYNAMTGFPGRIDRLVETIRPWLEAGQVRRALDAGCGNGVLLFALQRCGVEAVGIDPSEAMLRLALRNARDRKTRITIHGATHATVGQLYPGYFDAVFAIGNALIGAADHDEMTGWLRGLHGALRPQGRLLIQNLNLTPFLVGGKTLIMRRSAGAIEYTRFATPAPRGGLTFCVTIKGPGEEFDAHVGHWPAWERPDLTSCVASAGFRMIKVYGSLGGAAYEARRSTDLVVQAVK